MVAWVVGVLWVTRHGRGPVSAVPPAGLDQQRGEALAAIARLTAAAADRRVTPREVAAQLSIIMREVVGAATGTAVQSMTLEDLRAAPVPHLTELVTLLYAAEFGLDAAEFGLDAAEFGPDAADDVAPPIARSRDLVTAWR